MWYLLYQLNVENNKNILTFSYFRNSKVVEFGKAKKKVRWKKYVEWSPTWWTCAKACNLVTAGARRLSHWFFVSLLPGCRRFNSWLGKNFRSLGSMNGPQRARRQAGASPLPQRAGCCIGYRVQRRFKAISRLWRVLPANPPQSCGLVHFLVPPGTLGI